jgi:hypothetical protein
MKMNRLQALIRLTAALVWLMIVYTSEALSQDVQMPDKTDPPRRLYSENGNIPTWRWCIMGGVSLRTAPADNAPVLGQLEFFERVALADGFPERSADAVRKPYLLFGATRASNSDWALICEADPNSATPVAVGRLRGWVPRRYLTDRLEAETDERTAIHKKIVAVNPQQLADKPLEDVPAFVAVPGTTDTPNLSPRLSISLYQNLYAFADYGEYFLAATRPEIEGATLEELRTDILGWVPKERMAVWNTRECLEWDRATWKHRWQTAQEPERGPGRMFVSPADAVQAYPQLAASGSPGTILSVAEPMPSTGEDGAVQKLPKNAMRFHLLTDPKDAEREKLANARSWVQKRGGIPENWLYEIGGVISLREDSPDTEQMMERRRMQIEQFKSEVADLDLTFAIDDSLSNGVGLKAIATLVPLMVDRLAEDRGKRRIRVTLVYFADGTDKDKQTAVRVSPISAFELTSVSRQQLIDELENHQPFEAVAPHPLENLFDGIEQAVNAADFSRYSRKILFVLGECGDLCGMDDLEQNPAIGAAQRGVTTKARNRVRDIVGLIAAKSSSPVEVHAIQLKDPHLGDAQKFPYLKMFYGQINGELRRQYREKVAQELLVELDINREEVVDRLFTYTVFPTPVLNIRDPKSDEAAQLEAQINALVTSTLLPRIVAADVQGQTLRAMIKVSQAAGMGNSAEAVQKLGFEVSEADEALFRSFSKQQGLDKLLEWRKWNPYTRMYVWENSPLRGNENAPLTPQVRRKLLITETELTRAIAVLASIEKEHLGGRQVDLVQPASEVMRAATGGLARFSAGKSEEEKAQILYRALCFESPFFGPVLKVEPGRGKVVPGNADYNRLFLKLRLLECIRDGVRANPSDFVLRDGRYVRRTPPVKSDIDDRGFRSFIEGADGQREGGERYYYVDVLDEWP